MTRRAPVPIAVLAWAGSVVVATGLGLLAVGAIGAGIVGPPVQVLDATEVAARLDAARATAAPPVAPSATPVVPSSGPADPPAAAPVDVPLFSRGGTVVARCVDGAAVIVARTPAQGFETDSVGQDRVRFEADDAEVELRIDCAGGSPVAEVQESVDLDDDPDDD